MRWLLFVGVLLIAGPQFSFAQKRANNLNQYGIAPIFLGGLFREGITAVEARKLGSFGIAAPSLVDGELIEIDGRLYQTKANGETKIAPDSLKVPFGMFCFFKADTVLKISAKSNQQEIEQLITSALNNKNGIYAIRISGSFELVKTRAFHKVDQEPFPPVAEIQAAQQVFTFDEVKGTMFGYYMPVYMTGISGTGYHFHFLSEGRDKGGHILSYAGKSITVEIARIVNASLSIPNHVAFQNFIQSNSK